MIKKEDKRCQMCEEKKAEVKLAKVKIGDCFVEDEIYLCQGCLKRVEDYIDNEGLER